jgi:hypothetical protein
MSGDDPTRTAVLVLTVWLHGDPAKVAARIICTRDVSRPERVVVTAAGSDQIAGVVRSWLDQFVRTAGSGDGPVTKR